MRIDEPEVSNELRAPFPWFGGKRRVAELVWSRLGNVQSYNEPFAGSLAVLLARPHAPHVETVNDLDAYISNFWRALQHDPEGVAYHADGPVNEADLHARHRWLVDHKPEQIMTDPDFFDVRTAGWWVWGQCLWIGSGWCAETDKRNQHPSEQHKKQRSGDVGVHRRRWQGGGQGGGSGVHAPRLSRKRFAGTGNGQGTGVHSLGAQGRLSQQVPLLRASASASASGQGLLATGVHRKLPTLSQGGNDRSGGQRGLLAEGIRSQGLYNYLTQLSQRLRRVRVCCGDWARVLTPSVTTYIGTCGVFLDPPYDHELRERCYAEDHDVSADVRAWAIANGDNPDFRIAYCGYTDPKTDAEFPATWECVPWKAHGGYSRSERGVENRSRERIWFSPACLRPTDLLSFCEV